ncbi:LuxR C-terminal-related transcriptional regulator [Sanguibacter sp. HDW7]|uniref:response regulator transcription factor n=1 Tax=Sanguibacter sp. HDW7 TaxID=2714931 RepID=UPI00197D88E2|nr:LuxR C-terminal-related transcriptional regulator [Sanguibacter sp. HDW7]
MVARARIGVVDDHPSVILGVSAILNVSADLVVSAWGPTVDSVLVQDEGLDLVLLDLVLGDGSTPTLNVAQLRAAGVPVLAFTSGDRPSTIREAGRAGAVGMVRKSETPTAVLAAVRGALRGEVVATSDWAAALDHDTDFVTARLSDREAEVLALYASGETAERVARTLFISRQTVLDHLRRIRAKYAAVDRTAPTKIDLFHRAVEDGLVPPGG